MTRKRQIDHYAARGLRELEARQAWEAYVKSGRKPDDIPARPDLVYANEWRGWVDWLGWDVDQRRQVNLMGALERSLKEDREAIAEEKRDKIARRKVKLTRKEIDTFVESDRRWKRKE